MPSVHDILDQLREFSYDERDKGTRFEKLVQAYLKTEPQYSQLFDEVWMWNEYPQRGGRPDTGIDLVARNRETGELTAIQCKFFDAKTPVSKPMLDSFLAASSSAREGKPEFAERLIVSTSDNWGKNAEEVILNQMPPVSRLRAADLADSAIDWAQFSIELPSNLATKPKKSPFPHQQKAIENVIHGFESADRGKLIMACGTGKTFTSLQIVEQMVPAGGTVLFLVPSIALLSQTLKEWTIEASRPIRSFAVCSDVSVGKRTNDEDVPVVDLAYPSTTKPEKLAEKFALRSSDSSAITVIFSTYQSIDVVSKAQELGVPEFDLIVCDEAHRTTGVTLAGDEESAFVRVHNQDYIKGRKRLYMTATPRIYADASRSKAEEVGAVLTDMNNSEFFGEEFHRLGFGEAVSLGRLTDYKVLVLAVDESYISKRFQRLLADENNELSLDDAAKIVGCWNGLSKRALTQDEFALDPEPMKRAVAFAKSIADSKRIATMFERVVEREIELLDDENVEAHNLVQVASQHVDGTFNVLLRNEKLDWLKDEPGEGKARLLTNARCLAEGVDVPALDAVMFLNPRDSVVDVVQSVGRVMRKLEGKKYGYVILPIGVPADVDPSTALNDNKKYKVVWQVLQALRAHDERFDAEVNKIDLTKKTDRLQIGVIGKAGSKQDRNVAEAEDYGSVTLDFPELGQWREAILAKIVEKVGERRYWENWAKDVAGIAEDHIARITALVEGSDALLRAEFQRFLRGLQDNLNPFITERDAIEMLSQHLITKPVFDALFESYSFSDHNPVSQVMQGMVDALEGQNLDKETERLEKFYESVRTRAAGITDAAAKQSIVKELYEKFFRTAFTGTSDRLGIVYTPNEIVDFINHSVDDTLRNEFGVSISDEGVHVLDPFTGTGTFIVRLLQAGLIRPEDLARKYRYELHANEIVLLAYYVAAINIEETYHDLAGGDYESFNGIVLTDTFQMHEDDDELDGQGVFPDNNERVLTQKALDIRVIVGNPPYRGSQKSASDQNQNFEYPSLDSRIASTYVSRSTSTTKTSMYDSYIRAIRWASDRIGDCGVVAFVTNNSFIDGKSADGLRKAFADEFTSVYVLNLRGNSNDGGEIARKEGGNVFDIRVGVAIFVLVRNPSAGPLDEIQYFETEDYASKHDKLALLSSSKSIRSIGFEMLVPSAKADWVNQRSVEYDSFIPLCSSGRPADEGQIFKQQSSGIATKRDAWSWNYNRDTLARNIKRLISSYNDAVKDVGRGIDPARVIERTSSQIAWVENLIRDLKKQKAAIYDPACIQLGSYRPFSKQWVYTGKQLIWSRYSTNAIFPPGASNEVIVVSGPGSSVFSCFATNSLPEYHFLPQGVLFPRFIISPNSNGETGLFELEHDESKMHAVTDWAVDTFSRALETSVTKDDIFYYVYGVLHSAEFRKQFEHNLAKEPCRVPISSNFFEFSIAGRKLMEIHINYEAVEPFPLEVSSGVHEGMSVDSLSLMKVDLEDQYASVVVNKQHHVEGIPMHSLAFKIGQRSAVEWVVKGQQPSRDKRFGLLNDPNEADNPNRPQRGVVDLLSRAVTVSDLSLSEINSLPAIGDILG